jgi:hypothetical protein
MEIDETVSHSPTVTTNNKRNSTEDGSNNTVGGSIPVSSNLSKKTKSFRLLNKSCFNWPINIKRSLKNVQISYSSWFSTGGA